MSAAALLLIAEQEYEEQLREDLRVISTGIPTLDDILGIGGIPRGHVTEVTGGFAAGKSVLTWHMGKACQEAGGQVVLLDVDRALAIKYMNSVGLNTNDAIILRPCKIHDVTRVIAGAIGLGADMIIVDSIAAVPEASALPLKHMMDLYGAVHGSSTAVVVTNQYRTFDNKLQPMYKEMFEHIAPLSIDIAMNESLFDDGEIVGHNATICVRRNAFSALGHVCCLLQYGHGIDVMDCEIDMMLKRGEVVQRPGGWFDHGPATYHGRKTLKEALMRGINQ